MSVAFTQLARHLKDGTISEILAGTPRAESEKHKGARRVTPALLEQMRSDHAAGHSTYEIADRHGLNRHTVAEHLRRAGIVLAHG